MTARPGRSGGAIGAMTMLRPAKIPRSVLVVIHTPVLEVLLIERADRPGFWQSVTGSLDHDDEPLQRTARREVAEETGITGGTLRDWGLENVFEIYPVWRHRYAPGVTHNTERVFGLSVDRDVPVRLNPREHLRHVWLPWREAADRCFSPSNAEAILQLPHFAPGGTAGRTAADTAPDTMGETAGDMAGGTVAATVGGTEGRAR